MGLEVEYFCKEQYGPVRLFVVVNVNGVRVIDNL